jgi:5-methyltetrahydropteroyltriglutamate--homocysteine methyltransferase
MLMSTDRILVSHVGSLPRPPTLSELLIRQEAGETIDAAELARQVEIATTHVIDKQVEAGVDVGNDGEQSRVGFQTYVPRCLCGFGGESRRPPSRDHIDFPSYARQTELRFPRSARLANAPAALSDVQYVDSAPINEDAARLKRMGSRFRECFMTAPSPGIVATSMLNQHYDSHEAYLTALAKALSNEYRAKRRHGPPDRRPGSRDGATSVFLSSGGSRIPPAARTARRGDQSGDRGYSARADPAARLLGQQ